MNNAIKAALFLALGACRHQAAAVRPVTSPVPAPAPPPAMADVGNDGDGTFKVGPDFALDPDLTDKGAPQGRRFEFTMESQESHIYRGEDVTLKPEHQHPFSRKISVYVPASYKDGTPSPFLIVHDGPGPLGRLSRAVDNLSTSKDPNRTLPALVLIAVANGGSDSKGSERGLEYDTMSPRLATFINDEVLPAVLANVEIRAAYPKLAFTSDPWGRGAFGCSSGGAAALSMAWFRPDLFRRVIAYSATLVDQQDDDAPEEATYPLGAWEYHSGMKLIETTPRKPLRVFVHASEHDLGATTPEENHHNWPMANERAAAALKAAGYHYRYVFSLDSKHCDDRVFDRTMADTLVWAWRGYKAP